MSCYNKKDVENARDFLHAMQILAMDMGVQYIKISIDRISYIAEMLDEYANGNMVEE